MIYGSMRYAAAFSHFFCFNHTLTNRTTHAITIPQGPEYLMYCYCLLELRLAVLTRAIWLQRNVASVGRWIASREGVPWT